MQKLRALLRSRTFLVLSLMGAIFALAFLEAGWVQDADARTSKGHLYQVVPTTKPTKEPRKRRTRTPTYIYFPPTETPTATETPLLPTETASLTATQASTSTATALPSATDTQEPTLAPAPSSTPLPVPEEPSPFFSINALGVLSLIAALLGLVLLAWAVRRGFR